MNLSQQLLSFALFGGAEWVLWLLIGLSVLCLMIMIERSIALIRSATPMASLEAALAKLSTQEALPAVRDEIARIRGLEASVIHEGLRREPSGPDAVEEVMAGMMGLYRLRLERGVSFLGTVGSNAPFIGLFGTVLGIMRAFHDLSLNAGGGAEVVMASISEALLATAVGLMVAIPAVMAYNYFQRRIKQRISRLTALTHLAMAGLKARG